MRNRFSLTAPKKKPVKFNLADRQRAIEVLGKLYGGRDAKESGQQSEGDSEVVSRHGSECAGDEQPRPRSP